MIDIKAKYISSILGNQDSHEIANSDTEEINAPTKLLAIRHKNKRGLIVS